MNEAKNFRIVALAEATSFLLLLVATVVKYAFEAPLGVEILGPIHGVLFLAYVVMALLASRPLGWSLGLTLLVMLGAVVPFGGFVVDRRVLAHSASNTAR